jgi:hypothetical protein
MNTNAVIDVGIGILLMYLLLSLVCTMVNELFSSVLGLRAKTLETGLKGLIDNDQLFQEFQKHGIIAAQSAAAGGKPSYLAGGAVAAALLDSLDPNKPLALVSEVVSAAQQLPASNVRDAILTAATTAGDDIDKLRATVAAWFDDSMDRLSGVYKRYLHWLSLVVGIALAIALNADTISVAGTLWQDSDLRGGVAAAAGKFDTSNLSQSSQNLQQIETALRPFPLGWSVAAVRDIGFWGLLSKVLGLAMTGLALSLGAPFWFDMLSRFVNLRAAGVKPDRADAT